jgi:hypothetical protein
MLVDRSDWSVLAKVYPHSIPHDTLPIQSLAYSYRIFDIVERAYYPSKGLERGPVNNRSSAVYDFSEV